MAKKSVKSKRRANATRAAARAAVPHEEDHVDGCDIEIREEGATPDADLPAARGGVAVLSRRGRR